MREEIESILHLNGCQQRTAGHNEGYKREDLDTEDMERLEKITLEGVMEVIEKYCGGPTE